MRVERLFWSALVLASAMLVAACGNSTTSPSTVSAVTVTGTVPAVGSSSQFTATAAMSDGTTNIVTSTATWQSSNTAVATVSSTGVVTAVAAGSATITATFESVAGTDQITIPAASF